MTFDEAVAATKEIRLCGLFRDVYVTIERTGVCEVAFNFRSLVPDRDTGRLKNIDFVEPMPDHMLDRWSADDLITRVRLALHRIAWHEADEALTFRGARPFDPHATKPVVEPPLTPVGFLERLRRRLFGEKQEDAHT